MTENKCIVCQKSKPISEFKKHKRSKNGHVNTCLSCHRESMVEYYKTPQGLVTRILANQRKICQIRKHPAPSYTKKQLSQYLLNNLMFMTLFHYWKESGFKKELAPSLDRIDESKSYSFENIQIVTWQENFERSVWFAKTGQGSKGKQCKPVLQFTMNGEFVKEYISARAAQRETGILGIPHSLKGRHTHAGHFVWKFKEKNIG